MGNYKKKYKGVIWTNHVLQRLKERGLDQSLVWLAFRHPDTSEYATTKRAYRYQKVIGNRLIEVIAKKNDRGEWLILSCWSRPASRFKEKKLWWEKLLMWLKRN